MWCLVCTRLVMDRATSSVPCCSQCQAKLQKQLGPTPLTVELVKQVRVDLEEGLRCITCWSSTQRCEFCRTPESTCPECQPEGMCPACEEIFPFLDPLVVLAELNAHKRCGRCFSPFISNQTTQLAACGSRKIHRFKKHCGRVSWASQY